MYFLAPQVLKGLRESPIPDRRAMPLSSEDRRIFTKLYDAVVACDDEAKLVRTVYLMIDILRASNTGYEMQIKPLMMGVHPANRGGKKMAGVKMHRKGAKITKLGFSFKLCPPTKAICFEDSPETKAIETATIELTSSSELFATYEKGCVKAGSVGCGHLNQFLAAVLQGVPTPEKSLTDGSSDRISRRMIEEGNEDVKVALNLGLTWFVVPWEIEKEFPRLPDIFQRALNVEHHVGEGL